MKDGETMEEFDERFSAALEALTRSARTNTPRKTRPERFPAGGARRRLALPKILFSCSTYLAEYPCGNLESSTCVTLNGSGIQLAVGPQPLWLRNHNSGPAQRIMVKRLATSPHDPLGITDSACKNQSVVVSVQYGPFNPYIPIRSTTIGKSRVARDPTTMHTSWRSNSDIQLTSSFDILRKLSTASLLFHHYDWCASCFFDSLRLGTKSTEYAKLATGYIATAATNKLSTGCCCCLRLVAQNTASGNLCVATESTVASTAEISMQSLPAESLAQEQNAVVSTYVNDIVLLSLIFK
ncbi:hypothetical protein F511_15591 [Dorcoceras hygrometricum]|uniref:Uncharacterized protein n=1 Tax=Dorcoceras hygrometricum TaxID=472368 RepID=A0A2Z7B2E7_9LAMI|nr:hypothetical protein F511_15591 [Dorcoceras hygrometricum]